MIVYNNSSREFLEDVETNVIADKIKAKVLEKFGWARVRDNEEMSWMNSMQFMGNIIRRSKLADDCGILIEYNLPSTSLRVDFIISGHDVNNKPNFIIIELKQWTEAASTNKDGLVHTKYYGYTTHPSYQAYSYKLYLKDFNEYIYNSSLDGISCSYLHNYREKNPEPLKEKVYSNILKESPIFFKDDQVQLEEFIKKYVGNGKGLKILYEIDKGNIRPSKKLVDHVNSLFEGNQEFVLLDEQKKTFELVKDICINEKDKTVVIINGGPGTGKSVVAMNLLGNVLKRKNAIFIAPNSSFRDVIVSKLTSKYDRIRVAHLLKGSGSFFGARKNTFDVLIVDEAHRLKNGNAFMYKGKNQVEDIIKAANISVFFIDEKQMIRPDDIGTIGEIERVAKLNEAKIEKFQLSAQFRCSGADGYVNWVDDVLQLQSTGNFDGWNKKDFDFKIFDDPNKLREEIQNKSNAGLNARLLAGYAWKWTAATAGNSNGQIEDVAIPEFDFRLPWNSRQSGTTWAIDPEGIDQVGCVHTSQGLEFDYVGIIVGKDLQYNQNTGRYYTTWDSYLDTKGKQGLKNKPEELNRLVRNIYRILFTRGIKGCYVYFLDKETELFIRDKCV
jgi:DUF2075 family protein